METPPVCNYEGSTYQTTFWEQGGRAYEDAVEAVALKRLMPAQGNLLLELGAGAGRNTPRYAGFERIVLVDYSRTQLEQAQSALEGEYPAPPGLGRFLYVAADVYRLPFTNGLFDGATMIRTLHHMAEARLALEQTRRVLQNGATFVLEFANKQNLKAIARYLLKQQLWNPFSPEPVEFASLNFDFHPATVRSWLQLYGFSIQRQLTVSHFRMPVFKKIFPLGLLVWMDGMAQLTGNLWQLSPSVFVGCKVVGESPAARAGAFFRCPACGHDPLPDTPPVLTCPACKKTYPVENSIYDLRV